MTERQPAPNGTHLACGCVKGYERCFNCRPGLDPNQETACEKGMRVVDVSDELHQILGEALARDGESRDEKEKMK